MTTPRGIAIGPPRTDALGTTYRPLRWFATDGLLLAGRDYGVAGAAGSPLVCLPGLTRNSRDFEPVAARLAGRRRLVTIDFRGRGASERDPTGLSYAPPIEAGDVVAGLDGLGLTRVAILGTSRGGIVAMIVAALRPGLVGAAILNDIGPVIDIAGLLRIKTYVGAGRPPATWEEAAAAVRTIVADQFPDLDAAALARLARRLFREVEGRPVADYDPALARGLDGLTAEAELPTLWPQFDALAGVPLMLIRGATSDILSPATVAAMATRHPGMAFHEVPRQGHAPLLEDEPTLAAIATFLGAAAPIA